MTKQERAKLHSVIRSTVLELRVKGHNSNPEAERIVRERYPDLVRAYQEESFKIAFNKIVRDIRKSVFDTMKSPDFVLPLEIQHMRRELPAEISIEGDNDEHEPTWVALEDATMAELDMHLGMLSKQIANDQKRYKVLSSLKNFLGDHATEEHNDWAIGLILRMLADQDEKAS